MEGNANASRQWRPSGLHLRFLPSRQAAFGGQSNDRLFVIFVPFVSKD